MSFLQNLNSFEKWNYLEFFYYLSHLKILSLQFLLQIVNSINAMISKTKSYFCALLSLVLLRNLHCELFSQHAQNKIIARNLAQRIVKKNVIAWKPFSLPSYSTALLCPPTQLPSYSTALLLHISNKLI